MEYFGCGVLRVTGSVDMSLGSFMLLILISPVNCCDCCCGAITRTCMVCVPDSGVRFVPFSGMNVQMPHGG